jgi:hypothetical protein
MSAIRWIGLMLALLSAAFVFHRFRHNRIRRFDFLLGFGFAVSLGVVSAFPGSVSLLRDMLALKSDQFSRIIAILIISNLALWLLVFYIRLRHQDHLDRFDLLARSLGVAEFTRSHPEVTALPPVLVVIPAFNEAESVGEVIERVPAECCGLQVRTLIVDDGSSDGTLEAARSTSAWAVRMPFNRGGGAALRVGFDVARLYGARIVVTLDADGQHLPEEMKQLVEPIASDRMDFVIGSRSIGRREKDSLVRLVGIHFFNRIIRLLTPVAITDCSSGYRALRVESLSRVMLRQDQYHTSELIIEAAKKGIRIGEAPITVMRRHAGRSKKGRNLLYGLSFARTVFKTWWR